ncbi:MAG: sugar phosphate isomerase/epimerase [Verrucomicrobiales bacterium]|nr:sugar phosphate isomerase/epimerase [Verrucomicrobiales bacterium]
MQPTAATTRRRFLSTASATLVTSQIGSVAEESKSRPVIRKSLKHGMIKTATSIAEKFSLAKQAGFDGIEFDGPIPKGDIPQIREASAASGLVVPGLVAGAAGRMMGVDKESERQEGINRFSQALHDAKELGGNTVLLYPGLVNETYQYDVVYDRLQEAVAKLIPVSKETGVKIAFENVWNNIFLSPLEARDFVDSFNSTQVGWYFDVGNVVRFGWPEHWIRVLNKRILKLDIKEYSRKLQNEEGLWKGFSAKLGEGSVDWAEVMKALQEIDYQGGWGSAEVAGGDLERLTDISQRMDRVFAM